MLDGTLNKRPPSPARASRLLKLLVAFSAALMVVALVSGFVWWPRSPASLVNAKPQVRAQWLQEWAAGEVAVLVRHTERCDRSPHPCVGPADGITRVGSEAAVAVGEGLIQLGISQADVISSPVTRTLQTAHYMFGKDAQTQQWLVTCGSTLRNDVVAHKRPGHNLVLVTHSGCIGELEAQTGFKHAANSEYGSALFVHITAEGALRVLGIVKAEDWHSLADQKGLPNHQTGTQ